MSDNQSADLLAIEMPFASVVQTASGEALLIGGRVFNVTGPEGNCAVLFSTALRRGVVRTSGEAKAVQTSEEIAG